MPIALSRATCVRISSKKIDSAGSGALIGQRHVITCFHVIAALATVDEAVHWSIPDDLQVQLDDGETISARCVSLPTEAEPDPLRFDFAVLELSRAPSRSHPTLSAASPSPSLPAVGDAVLFSGFPLATPAMLTHRGMVSGVAANGEVLCVQAPINKGNSGGALISASGQLLGIVSMREGGISKGLAELVSYIDRTAPQGSVAFMGVDPLQSIKALTRTLDTYISTGIGYARNAHYVREYLARHPLP